MRGRLVVVLLALALAVPAAALARDFDNPASKDTSQQFAPGNVQRQDTPNDPGYDFAEPDDEDGPASSTNVYDEDFGFFGFPSARTPSATYSEGPNSGKPMISGFNAAGAWKLTRGDPGVSIAILDTGIKWDRSALRTKVRLNRGELPVPDNARVVPLSDGAVCPTYKSEYDANGDGAFNVLDYACDSRVKVDGGVHGDPKAVDPEDLIAAFSDSSDGDGNHYVDDIAGWDFFDNDNDPYDASSYFAASNHGSGRADEAAAATNDKNGDPGVCPKCQLVPLRIWDTFVSDQNSFALAMVYASDNGVSVIEGSDGGLYHSAFAEKAAQYAYDKGLVMTFSGDDLNTGNHNYPANYNHTMLIEGTVPDAVGLGMDFSSPVTDFLTSIGQPVGTQIPTKTYFRGAGTTQYGGHSSVSMEGSTGSENTGKASGAAGMVISAARAHAPDPITLRPDETREILEQTAEDVTGGASGIDGNVAGVGLPDYAQVGWDPHFGWGRVDLGKAVSLANSGKIPPEVAIDSPDWYAPLPGSKVQITGRARARFADGGKFHWKLEWGAGVTPQNWTTAAEGDSSDTVTDFGTVDLDKVRQALASYSPPNDPGLPTFAPGPDPYQGQFNVRVTVTGEGIPTAGVDRKVLTALDDKSLSPGYPKRMAAGGEAPLQYADVNGDNVQELVTPVEDGSVHVYEPDGSELPGFPVTTGVQAQAEGHLGAPGVAAIGPPLEPPRAVTVADLDDDGQPELITNAGIHIYVWEPDGSMRPGFPVSIDRSFCKPENESQPLHHPKCGFLASPAVGRLEGQDKPLDIVAPALDGHVYGVRGDGTALPGFPVALVDPAIAPKDQMLAESINNPAIGDLNGDGTDDVVAASNESYDANPPSGDDVAGLIEQGIADLLANAAGGSTRVYAINGKDGKFLPGWPIKLNGGIQSTLPLVGPGHDPAIADIGGSTQIVASATGGALSEYAPDGSLTRGMQQSTIGPASKATDKAPALNLFESAAVGDVLGTGTPDIVKYHTTLAAATNLLLTGQNNPWQHLMGAYDGQTGAPLPSFPAVFDDYQFLSAPTIASVDTSTGANQILAGSGLGLLHAYDGLTGQDVSGFPKVTGGWLFAPATLSNDQRMADITREGFLFQWKTGAASCQSEWPDFRHDLQRSGNYDRDGNPPGAAFDLALGNSNGRAVLNYKDPGDDLLCGKLTGGKAHIDVVQCQHQITPANFGSCDKLPDVAAPADPKSGQSVTLPAAVSDLPRFLAVRATDDAGNVGPIATLDVTQALVAAGIGAPGPGPGAAGGGAGATTGGSAGGAAGAGSGGTTVCASSAGFRSVSVRASGRGLHFGFAPAASNPVTVDVFESSIGRRVIGDRRVAHFTGRRSSFSWNGRGQNRVVRDGFFYARLHVRGANGVTDTRRFTFQRRAGRFHRHAPHYGRALCTVLSSVKLTRPVFGGPTHRAIGLAYRLTLPSLVTVEIRRGGELIRRYAETPRANGKTFRITLRPGGLARGDYHFKVTGRFGPATESQTLTARLL